jgi:hypothetical protein
MAAIVVPVLASIAALPVASAVRMAVIAAAIIIARRAVVLIAAIAAALIGAARVRPAPTAAVSVEIDDAALGGHPLDPVMRVAVLAHERLGVRQASGMMGADLRQDSVKRLPAAPALRQGGRSKRHQRQDKPKDNAGFHGAF